MGVRIESLSVKGLGKSVLIHVFVFPLWMKIQWVLKCKVEGSILS